MMAVRCRAICGAQAQNFGHRLFQPRAEPHRADFRGQSGLVVGFDRDTAQGGGTGRRLEALGGDAAQEARQRLVLDHADHGIIIAGHADIGNESRAARQDLVIGGRRMRVRADHEAGAAVDEMTHRLFLAGRLAMKVEHDRVGAGFERAGIEFMIDRW